MAGPAIRSWEMARLLSARGHEVRLAAAGAGEVDPPGFEVVALAGQSLRTHTGWADVLVVQGLVTANHPALVGTGKRMVVDLYDPYVLETLEMYSERDLDYQLSQYWPSLSALLVQLRVGDFFLCANDRQRDFWMGMLVAANRVNPHTLRQDHLLRSLIDVAPFGTPSEPPRHSGKPAAKGAISGIAPDDRLAIWAGGIYNWFDPLSLIRAWPRVLESVSEARLLFLGVRHPNPVVPEMAMTRDAIRLAEELGLRGRSVFFNQGWVPYERRADFLLESDVGVSMHLEHLETRVSFRTRFLDYIWAALPVVATEGDAFAEWAERSGAGTVVGYEDVDAIAAQM